LKGYSVLNCLQNRANTENKVYLGLINFLVIAFKGHLSWK